MLQNMITEEDALGRELFAGDESVFEFACYDTDGNTQLQAWAAADTEVELVSAGLQENVLWYEPATIKVIKPFSFATKNRNYTRVRIFKSGGAHKVWRGVNLLDGAVKIQGFETGWQDSNSNGLADGYGSSGLKSTSFETGLQKTIQNPSGYQSITLSVTFPVDNIQLSLSVNYTRMDNDVRHYVKNINHAGDSAIQIVNATYNATGRTSALTLINQAGTFDVGIDVFGSPGSGAVEDAENHGKDAVLRIGTSNEYTAY